MSFVRAKLVKGQKYAYLVENIWKKGKVKQKVKRYLGRVVEVPDEEHDVPLPDIDMKKPLKYCVTPIIVHEFLKRGFERKRQTLMNGDLKVNLSRYKIIKDGKDVVLFLNGRYLYPSLLRNLVSFYEPETDDDRKGEKLAKAFSDAGISIAPEHFVSLYKKIYLNKGEMIKKED